MAEMHTTREIELPALLSWRLELDDRPALGDNIDFITDQLTPWMETMARASWAAVRHGYSV